MAVISTYLLCLHVQAQNHSNQALSGFWFISPPHPTPRLYCKHGTIRTETNEITRLLTERSFLQPVDSPPASLKIFSFMESVFPEETGVLASELFQNQNWEINCFDNIYIYTL